LLLTKHGISEPNCAWLQRCRKTPNFFGRQSHFCTIHSNVELISLASVVAVIVLTTNDTGLAMTRQKVLLFGATGETGGHILDALVTDDSFVSVDSGSYLRSNSLRMIQDLTCFVRTSSKDKQSTKQLRGRGIAVVTAELQDSIGSLVALLHNVDIIICSMSPAALKLQIPLIDAAVAAGVKRFLPCNWGTPSSRGILTLRDIKEEVHDHMFRHRLSFTIVDTGFWYQASIPRVPSGALDDAIFMSANDVYAGGSAPNMLIDARDIGKMVVRIIKDERTLNKRVIAYGAVLSQNAIHEIIEKKTDEKLDLKKVRSCSQIQRPSYCY